MKFLVDLQLGGLAKWLRFCGFDAQMLRLPPGPFPALPPPAPGTFILTRQRKWAGRNRPDLVIITAPAPQEQLEEVVRHLGINSEDLAPLSRCSRCNDLLIKIPREETLGLVPEHVFHRQERFYQCPRCRQVFWPGSHLKGISGKLREMLEKAEGG
ncbi:MAG: hypothetical protein FJ134_15505 [Deltaproteobacteria bacterium]|nr:hypothetical protein [Deltaproteobacteria bacterium]